MRRAEFEVTDKRLIENFLETMQWGVLSLADAETIEPYGVPLNYVWDGGRVLLHCANEGRKMKLAALNPRAHFTVAEGAAFIPSYFLSPLAGCSATQFFRSVMISGAVRLPGSPAEKAQCLNAILGKYQPGGGYRPLAAEDAGVKGTAVLVLEAESVTAKFKFGQHLGHEAWDKIAAGLGERDAPGDRETLEWMRALRPAR